MILNVGALNINGFKLEVWERDGLSNVRIRMKDEVIVQTNRLSIDGLRNIAKVFETAADLAYEEMDRYWHHEHLKMQAKRQQA